MKFVFWLVLIVIVVMALRAKFARARSQAEQAMRRQAAAQGRPHESGEAQTMVSCAQCGLYIPAPEAVSAGGVDFCCEQHRRQFQA